MPTVSELVVYVDVLEDRAVPEPSGLPPSKNVTVPLSVPVLPAAGVTVAVKVTLVPATIDPDGEAITAVVVE